MDSLSKPQTPFVEKTWIKSEVLRVLGVDPGFASMGVAILEQVAGQRPRVLELKVLETQKASKKTMRNLRVADDDDRRYRELWSALSQLVEKYVIDVVSMENYQPYKAVGSGAWKTARVCGLVMGWALARPGLSFLSFNPQDLKRGAAGSVSASKEEVQAGLVQKVDGLEEHIQKFAKSKHEHISDATGHAYLAFDEIQKLRRMCAM